MSSVDLGQKFSLDIRIIDGGAVIGCRRNNLEQPAERTVSKNLTGASRDVRVVLLQQADESGAGDITEEIAHGGRACSGNLRVVGTASIQHLHYLNVRDDRSTAIGKVRASRCRKTHHCRVRIGITPGNAVMDRRDRLYQISSRWR